MSIKDELNRLNETDVWSFLLFVLFKLKDISEYSSVSELAYILDKKNLLRFCEYFGGCTLVVPTIAELETLIYSLLIYQYTEIEHYSIEEAFKKISDKPVNHKEIRLAYYKLKKTLTDYSFSARGRKHD